MGPYSELHRTYAALHAWCKGEGLRIGSQSWEVYGDWQADSSRLETELYLRLGSPATVQEGQEVADKAFGVIDRGRKGGPG